MNTFLYQTLAVAVVVAALLTLNRRGGTQAAGIATAALSAPTLLLLAMHQGPAFALQAAVGTLLSTPLCAGIAALGLRWLARAAPHPGAAPRGHTWAAALLAGLVSACVCAAAHELGALASGIIGGLPVVAAWTALGTRWHGGSGAAARYLHAYRRGLWLRAVMTLVFAAAVLPLGALFALPLALLASGLAATRIRAAV